MSDVGQNVPLTASLVTRHAGDGSATACFFHVDATNVVVETVKRAETGDDLVVRLYESQGMRVRTRLHSAFRIARAWEVDLMEENERDKPAETDGVELAFDPYEIRTLRLTV